MSYNNPPSGVPKIIAVNNLTSQTTPGAAIVAPVTPNDGLYRTYQVSSYLSVNAISLNTLSVKVDFTDDHGYSQTLLFSPQGVASPNITTSGFYGFPPMNIRTTPNTAISVNVIVSGVGSQDYNVGASVILIN